MKNETSRKDKQDNDKKYPYGDVLIFSAICVFVFMLVFVLYKKETGLDNREVDMFGMWLFCIPILIHFYFWHRHFNECGKKKWGKCFLAFDGCVLFVLVLTTVLALCGV